MAIRFTGLVISNEGNDVEDTLFDMMLQGDAFYMSPIIAGQVSEEASVHANVLQVIAHPKCRKLLIVLKVIGCHPDGIPFGTYALVFNDGLVCADIPSEPLDYDSPGEATMHDRISARISDFFASSCMG